MWQVWIDRDRNTSHLTVKRLDSKQQTTTKIALCAHFQHLDFGTVNKLFFNHLTFTSFINKNRTVCDKYTKQICISYNYVHYIQKQKKILV